MADKKVGLCLYEGSMSLLVSTRLSQPWRSCGSSKFLIKNNLIEKLLLPSASGRHKGHRQQHSAACGQLHPTANKPYVHVCALGKDKRHTAFILSHHPHTHRFDAIVTFQDIKAMNQHLCDDLKVRFVHFCLENMPIFSDAKVRKAQSQLRG